MKKNKFLVFLIFVIFSISFSIDTQATEAYHFEVEIYMDGNDYSSGLNVICNFTVYRDGNIIKQVAVVQTHTGDADYYFDSDFIYKAGDTFRYTVYCLDSIEELEFYKRGTGDSDNRYVTGTGYWMPINEQ